MEEEEQEELEDDEEEMEEEEGKEEAEEDEEEVEEEEEGTACFFPASPQPFSISNNPAFSSSKLQPAARARASIKIEKERR